MSDSLPQIEQHIVEFYKNYLVRVMTNKFFYMIIFSIQNI
jgi:hypothetical protein